MLRIILTVMLTVATLCLATLGIDWIEVGHGLHPVIAFPMATICAGALMFLLYLSIDDVEPEDLESTCSRFTSNDAIKKNTTKSLYPTQEEMDKYPHDHGYW